MRKILFFICLLLSGSLFGSALTYTNKQAVSSLGASSTVRVADDFISLFNPSLDYLDSFNDKKVNGRIKLYYHGQLHQRLSTGAWYVRVKFNYICVKNDGTLTTPQTHTLTVSGDYSANTMTDLDVLDLSKTLPGIDIRAIQVYNFTVTKSGFSTIPADIILEPEIEVERYFNMDAFGGSPITINHLYVEDRGAAGSPQTPATTTTNRIELYWNYYLGAEEYDLEYYFVSEEVENFSTYTAADIPDERYTRVTLRDNHYFMNMVYERGKLFYRVRPVSRFGPELTDRLEGAWSADALDYYTSADATNGRNFIGINVNTSDIGSGVVQTNAVKNWTYQASFAENGKKKEVLSIFDGAGRNRESVTLTNTEDVAMVAESFYDYEGRPVISALPAPSADYSNVLRYYGNLNRNDATISTYNGLMLRKNYDVAASEGDCDPVDLQLSTTEGSSRYYSPDNARKEGFNAYIPDGLKYTYVRTQFNRDGSVAARSGTGDAHTLASGHAIQMYHASPLQEKLDRVLGSHAGFASHYTLEAVTDANGQTALTYKNLSGQVVMTSMTGASPASLKALESNTGATDGFTASFNSDNVFSEAEPAYVVNKTIFIEAAGDYTFTYTLTPAEYSAFCGKPGGDCTYDVVFEIHDRCGAPVTEDAESREVSPGGAHGDGILFSGTPYTFTTADAPVTISFEVPLAMGTYTIYKKITLNEAALAAETEAFREFLLNNPETSCISPISIDPIYNCFDDCADFCAQMGLEECPCETPGDMSGQCDELLTALAADMAPGGQYYDGLTGSNEWLEALETQYADNVSGYNTSCGGSATYDFWTEFNTANGTSGFSSWSDVTGWINTNLATDADFIYDVKIPVSTVSSCTLSVNTVSIVKLHPEFCLYEKCEALQASAQYDYDMLLSVYSGTGSTYYGATPGTTALDEVLDGDPLNTGWVSSGSISVTLPYGLGTASYTWPAQDLETWMFASPQDYEDGGANDLWQQAYDMAAGSCICTPSNDLVWQYFVGLYNGAKQTYINSQLGFCNYLCDNSFPFDQVADACPTGLSPVQTPAGTIAVTTLGYHINVAVPSQWLINSGTSDPDLADVGDYADQYSPLCENYIEIDLCDINICYDSETGYSTDKISCSSTGFQNMEQSAVFINGVQISSLFDPMDDIFTDCDFSTLTGLAGIFAAAINGHTSTPEWHAEAVNDCTIRISRPGNAFTGFHVYFGQGSFDVHTGFPLQGSCTYDLGTIQDSCRELAEQSCFCSDLINNYNYLYEEAGLTPVPGHLETIETGLFDEMETLYVNMGVTVEALTLQGWFENCVATGHENVEEGFSAEVPAGLLYDCQTPGCEDDPEPAAIAGFYEAEEYLALVEEMVQQFIAHYKTTCFYHVNDGGEYNEQYTISGKDYEYHYTVYYYDQAGNLTTTVPPKGVKLLDNGSLEMVAKNRLHPTDETYPFTAPGHTLLSLYRYNSYNQLTEQNMPDANDMVTLVGETVASTGSSGISFTQAQLLSSTHGYALGTGGSIYETVDGGATWTSTSLCSTSVTPTRIQFMNSENVLIISGGVLKYKSGSVCWTNVSGLSSGYTDFVVVGGDVAYALSSGNIARLSLNNINDPSAFTVTATVLCTLGTAYNRIQYDGGHILYLASTSSGAVAAVDLDAGTPGVVASTSVSFTYRTMQPLHPNMLLLGGTQSSLPKISYTFLAYDAGTSTYSFTAMQAATVNHSSPVSTGNVNTIHYDQTGTLYAVGNSTVMTSADYGLTWNDMSGITVGSGVVMGAIASNGSIVVLGGTDFISTITASVCDQRFFYDRLGRIKASQNSLQHGYAQPAYSYSTYDALGRITEVGQTQSDGSFTLDDPTETELDDSTWPGNWMTVDGVRTEVSYTQYDNALTDPDVEDMFADGQQNLRKRVSSTWFKDHAADAGYKYASHYSYDVHGNVSEFVQEYTELEYVGSRFKKMEYDYDLISGNVNAVVYQRDQGDQFMHRYWYDADNRLVQAETSRDAIVWDRDAKYYYYLHGPLARREVGHYKVQGQDFAYTLQGWLKGVNANVLDAQAEMGKDAYNSAGTGSGYYSSTNLDLHRYVATDAFGYSLGYYNGTYDDYAAIGTGTGMGNSFLTDAEANIGGNNLFNGNIRHMAVALMDASENELALRGTNYYYDQLNRLADASSKTFTAPGNSYTSGSSCLGEHLSYDANGNIQTYKKYDQNNTAFDDLGYIYDALTNRLSYVTDDAGMSSVLATDIDAGQSANNYVYDARGHLTADVQENITGIEWNARDKVKAVNKSTGSNLEFEYDGMGHRVRKRVKTGASQDSWADTWYVLDAMGNVMAVYKNEYTTLSTNNYRQEFELQELDVYGSERLGLKDQEVTLFKEDFTCTGFTTEGLFNHPTVTTTYSISEAGYLKGKRTLQDKKYELSNHLGNVLAVVTGYKVPVVSSGTNVDYYKPDVVSYSDYYGFGMQMPGRNGNTGDYAYGFQGQLKDDEIKGAGNSINFEYRMHDPRLGRFFAIDPLAAKYPYWTPYAFSGNRVVDMVELEGLEPKDPEGEFEVIEDHGNDYYAAEGIEGNLSYVKEKATGNYMYLLSRQNENGSYMMMTNPGGENGVWSYHIPEGYQADGVVPTRNLTEAEINRGKSIQYLLKTARQWREHDFAGKLGAVIEFTILTAMTIGLAPEASFLSSSIRNEVAAEGGGTFYRAMGSAEYAALESGGGLSHMAGKELFVSSSSNYSRAYLQKSGYDVLVQFNMKPGAMNYFNQVGVMHRTAAGASGWAGRGSLLWKSEQGVMNLGIHSNTHMFNPWIQSFKVIK